MTICRLKIRWLLMLPMLFCLPVNDGSVAAQSPEAATRQFAAAVALQNRGVYELAAEEWVKFIHEYRTDPRRDKAHHYLGVCYLKSNQPDLALQSFGVVLSSFPKSEIAETSHLYLGLTQYTLAQSGKADLYAKALATFVAHIAQYPQGKSLPQALFYRGECLYALGKKAEAAQAYARLIDEFPQHSLVPDALYTQGVAQQESSQTADAGKTFDQFLQKFPQNPLIAEVAMRRGETFFTAGQYGAAAEKFAQAAGQPGFALADRAQMRQAAALSQGQHYAQAADVYAALPVKYPKSTYVTAAHLAAGRCFYLANKFTEASTSLAKVPDADPSAAEAAHWMARCKLKQHAPADAAAAVARFLKRTGSDSATVQLRLDQADAFYEIPERRKESARIYAELAAKHPDDPLAPQALYMAAFAAMNLADYPSAIQHAQAFLGKYAAHDLTPDVLFVAAESYLQRGQLDEARKFYARLLDEYPKHPDVDMWKVRRAFALHMDKKFAEVLATLEPMVAHIRAPEVLAEAQFLVGSSQTELRRFEPAVRSLEASLAASPQGRQSADALLLLAYAYRQLNQLDKASATLRRLIAEHPQSGLLDRAHCQLADHRYAAHDFDAAAAAYQAVVDRWPQSPLAPAAWYGLSWARLGRNDYAGAEQAVSSLLVKFPHDKFVHRARYLRGTARHQLKNDAGAIQDLQAVISADVPLAEKSDARYVLALCQVARGEHATAVSTLKTLLKDDQKYAQRDKVFYELAWAYKALHQEAEAAQAFTWLVEGYPQSTLAAESDFHLAELAFQKSNFVQAAERYQAATKKAGNSPLAEKATHKQGWAFYRHDDFDAARAIFAHQRAAWPNGPLHADATFMEAECYFKIKDYAHALELYRLVKKPQGKDFGVLTLLHAGQAAAQRKEWDRSQQLLEEAARTFPDSTYLPEVLYEQGWAQQNRGRGEAAINLYEQVIARSGAEVAARAQFMIGEIHFENKNHAEALKSFIKVAYGYSYPKWKADAMYEAARCLEILGRKPQAAAQYRELIDQFPASDKTPLARLRVGELVKP